MFIFYPFFNNSDSNFHWSDVFILIFIILFVFILLGGVLLE